MVFVQPFAVNALFIYQRRVIFLKGNGPFSVVDGPAPTDYIG
jgi:hypothetical protein